MSESFQNRIGCAFDAENHARAVAKSAINTSVQKMNQERIVDLVEAWVEAHARRRVLKETGRDG